MATVLVVLDLVVRLHAEPVRDGAALLASFSQQPATRGGDVKYVPVLARGLGKGDLGAERLVRGLHGQYAIPPSTYHFRRSKSGKEVAAAVAVLR